MHVVQTADSHPTISMRVPSADLKRGVDALHEEFALAEPRDLVAGEVTADGDV